MIGAAPATCLYLSSYEISKRNLQSYSFLQENPSILYLGAGMLAETLSCVLWVPIDVVKERMQVQVQSQATTSQGRVLYYRNTLHAVQSIMQTEKLKGLYRGYGATLLSFGPFSALYFMFYEKVHAFLIWFLQLMCCL